MDQTQKCVGGSYWKLACVPLCRTQHRVVGVEEFPLKPVVNFDDEGLAKCWRVKVVILQEEEAVWPMVGVDVSCFDVEFVGQNFKICISACLDESVHVSF